MGTLIDLTNHVYGRLIVLYRDKKFRERDSHAYWVCQCSCGNICFVSSNCLRRNKGGTKSCGCLKKETARKNGRYLGGIAQKYPAEYHTWLDIKGRCYNQNNSDYVYYGGRGIEVCNRWKTSFKNFLEDMGPRPFGDYSIERLENNEGYTPENCKWGTRWEQAANTRKNVLYCYDGEIIHQRALARKLNVDHHTIARQYQRFRIE